MKEHRLIEQMMEPIKKQMAEIDKIDRVNTVFVELIVDFVRTYVDHCHHGKEEGILFRELGKRNISDEHSKTMGELIQEHVYARKTTTNLQKANEDYIMGDLGSLKDIQKCLSDLAELYPQHIRKEDNSFFNPSMEYFTQEEHEAMLQEFYEFDRKLIHEKYSKVLDGLKEISSNWEQLVSQTG
jgi:hemerythrin-like domain-containing protein